MLITKDQMRSFAGERTAPLAGVLTAASERWGIDTDKRLRCWMATLHHESGGFVRMRESLNYSVLSLIKGFSRDLS